MEWGLPRVCDVGGGPAEGGGETHVGVGEVREEAGVGAEGGLQRDDGSVKSWRSNASRLLLSVSQGL